MAVYQISRIQIRRGQANTGTGIPQLASGEMAWAVDAQELYIGNGSIAEGSPAVGNTRILSINDLTAEGNVLKLLQYAYKVNDTTIQTSVSGYTYRSMQDHLDDTVSVTDFGTVADGVTDDTAAFQLAINQLYLNANNYAYNTTSAGTSARVLLNVPAGIYLITSTLYIPSYVQLVGAGIDKTIIRYTPAVSGDTTPAIRFINDTSTAGNPNAPITSGSSSSFQFSNQPRYITIKDLTVNTTTGNNPAFQLDAVRNGLFENIKILSNTSGYTTYNSTNVGFIMNAHSNIVTCEANVFKNIKFFSVGTAVYAQQDIVGNSFTDVYVEDARYGFSFGAGSIGGSAVGQQYGPVQSLVSNVRFKKIRQHAIYIERGEYNSFTNIKMIDVGNDSAGNLLSVYPQVYVKTPSNILTNIQSDRADDLSLISSVPYLPEISGNVSFASEGVRQIATGQTTNPVLLFRLPISTDYSGAPGGSTSFSIKYLFKSTTNAFSRKGVIDIAADVDNRFIQLSDDYEFVGVDWSSNIAQKLDFTVYFLDATGNIYTGAPGQVPYSIAVYYLDKLNGNAGQFNYSYTATTCHS